MDCFKNALRTIYYRICHIHSVKEWVKEGLVIGENFHMFEVVIIDSSHIWHIEIGDDVTLAPRVLIFAHDGSTKKHVNYTKIGRVKIGNRVFIGAGSVILPGVTIGDDAAIGAGSVVTRDIPDARVAPRIDDPGVHPIIEDHRVVSSELAELQRVIDRAVEGVVVVNVFDVVDRDAALFDERIERIPAARLFVEIEVVGPVAPDDLSVLATA